MLDFVYVVTYEYESEYEVLGATVNRKYAKEFIAKTIETLPLMKNTEERKDEDNYYITGVEVYKDMLSRALDKIGE